MNPYSVYLNYIDKCITHQLTAATCCQLDCLLINIAANIKVYSWFLIYIIPHCDVNISMILDLPDQEAGRGGQGGSELGTSEGSEDPGAGSVRATAPVQDQPAGDRTAAVQVRIAACGREWVECTGTFTHPFTHHLPVRSADLKFNERTKANSLSYSHCELELGQSRWVN